MPEFDLEVLAFKTPKAFATFLAKNHARPHGIWLRIFNKGSGVKTITYAEALDEALCHGWIDGHIKKYDDTSHVRRFTPRRTKSMWSKINKGHVARLIKEGRMKPPGLKQVELAQSDGRWDAAYDSSRTITLPDEFVAALTKNKKAKAFYDTLNKANTYAIAWRLQTAKRPETKAKRMKEILERLKQGKKPHE